MSSIFNSFRLAVLSFSLFLAFTSFSRATDITGEVNSVQSGNWSDPATWGYPGTDTVIDQVYGRVGDGHTVHYDTAPGIDNPNGFTMIGNNATLVLDKDVHFTSQPRLGGYGTNATLDTQGFSLTSDDFLSVGIYIYGGATPNSSLIGGGKLFIANNLTIGGGGSSVNTGGGAVGSVRIGLYGDGTNANFLKVSQTTGQQDGLTVTQDGGGAIQFDEAPALGQIALAFDGSNAAGPLTGDPSSWDWALRWKGDHVSDLQALYGTGQLTVNLGVFNAANNIVYDAEGDFTYVGLLAAAEAVPEPSTFVLGGLGLLGLGALVLRRKIGHA